MATPVAGFSTPVKRKCPSPAATPLTPVQSRTATAAAAAMPSSPVERRLDFGNTDGDADTIAARTTPDAPQIHGSPAKKAKPSPIPYSPQPTATPQEASRHADARAASAAAVALAMRPSDEGFSRYGHANTSKAPPAAPTKRRPAAPRAGAAPAAIRALMAPAPTDDPQAIQRLLAGQREANRIAHSEAATAKATDLLGQGEIVAGGKTYRLTELLGRGHFMETWATDVPGKVVKRFHDACIRAKKGEVLQLFLREGVQNFRDLKALGIPLADIDNLDTMVEEMVVVQDLVQLFDKKQKLSNAQLTEIRGYLQLCFERDAKQRLGADMSQENFGILNGKIVFIDVVGTQTAFQLGTQQYLESFAHGDPSIYKFLDPRPPAAPAGKK